MRKPLSTISIARTFTSRSIYQWVNLFSPRMTLVTVLLLALLVSGISVIYTTFKNRSMLNELQVQWGQLLIEQSTFSLDSRIERKAIEELQMIVPEFSDVVMVRYD